MRNIFISLLCIICIITSGCTGNLGEDSAEKLVLSSTKSIIEADGNDETLFTVKIGENDVTNEAQIFKNSEEYDKTSFSTTESGKYSFSAVYEGLESDKLTVEAVNTSSDIKWPADSNEELFADFKKRIVLLDITSTSCLNCPYVLGGIIEYQKAYPEQIIPVAIHFDDEMKNDASVQMNSWFSPDKASAPWGIFNLNKDMNFSNPGSVEKTKELIQTNVSLLRNAPAATNISVVTTASDVRGVTVNAKVKVGQAGQYKVIAWLLEDNIHVNSQQQEPESGLVEKYDLNSHKHVLQMSSTEREYGDFLESGKKFNKGDYGYFEHTFDVKNSKIHTLSNCYVVLAVLSAEGNAGVDNAVVCPLNSSIPFEYEK